MLFVSQPSFSMYGARYSYINGEIIAEDSSDDEQQKRMIRNHNARVIQQRIEMTNDFYECCTRAFTFLKSIFFCFHENEEEV